MIGEQYGPNTLFISFTALTNVWYVLQQEKGELSMDKMKVITFQPSWKKYGIQSVCATWIHWSSLQIAITW